MTKEQLVQLARADVDRSTDRLEQVYRWRVERDLTTLRATFVVAGSILGAWLAAVFTRADQAGTRQAVITVAGLACSFAAAAYQYARLGRLYDNYLKSLGLLRLVQRPGKRGEWTRSHFS